MLIIQSGSVVGDALKDRDVPIDHVYASPSLRCVETATAILQGDNKIIVWLFYIIDFTIADKIWKSFSYNLKVGKNFIKKQKIIWI